MAWVGLGWWESEKLRVITPFGLDKAPSRAEKQWLRRWLLGEGELPIYGNELIIVFILSLHNKRWYFIIKLYPLNPITLLIIFIFIFISLIYV
jgi:hypothetical protein